MKLIKPSFEIIEQSSGSTGIYKQIELAGRTCYKSENKITKDSAKEFVDRMIRSGHGAMLEHGTVYLTLQNVSFDRTVFKYHKNKYSVVKTDNKTIDESSGEYYVTTNYRVLIYNNWLEDLQYQCEPTEYHEKRINVRFICDRGISHELVRHRTFSFAQESTRYCNYSKDKFDNQITFVVPPWVETEKSKVNLDQILIKNTSVDVSWVGALVDAEQKYFTLIEKNWQPQQARSVLPNSLKTEIVMTGFVSDWKHFFKLRCVENAHPQMRELAIPLEKEFKKRGFIK